MPATERRYCIIGVHWADNGDKPELLAVNGQIVIFDTANIARETLPRLYAGRRHVWDAAEETLTAIDFSVAGFNRLSIWTGYDPYDVPNGFRQKGIYSEAESRDWKHHVYWRHVLPELLAWADDMEAKRLDALTPLARAA